MAATEMAAALAHARAWEDASRVTGLSRARDGGKTYEKTASLAQSLERTMLTNLLPELEREAAQLSAVAGVL